MANERLNRCVRNGVTMSETVVLKLTYLHLLCSKLDITVDRLIQYTVLLLVKFYVCMSPI